MAEDGENLCLAIEGRVKTGSSDSLAASSGGARRRPGRIYSARMKKPVSCVLLAAAFALAVLVGITSGASADQRTLTVQLTDGSTTTVTTDVPTGTSLTDIQLPPPPTVTTTSPLPVPILPTSTSPTNPPPSDQNPQSGQ